jgi:hypothetical protein
MEKDPAAAKNLADPDIQSVMFEAQKEYARSGEEDLAKVLVDLLTDRTTETERSLRTLVLNEAISSVPKLTEQQRRAIGLVFLVRYSRWTGNTPTPEDCFREFMVKDVLALGGDLPTSALNYQHIEYVGAGSVSISSISFASALRSGVEGLFTRGFQWKTFRRIFEMQGIFRALSCRATESPRCTKWPLWPTRTFL